MRVYYLSIMGEPGTYDPDVYRALEGGDHDGLWFARSFAHLPGVEIASVRVSHGDPPPAAEQADAFILGGSYNSVHDDYPWQRALDAWFDHLAETGKPLLAICGGHQLLCRYFGAEVTGVEGAPLAGTLPVDLTPEGQASDLFQGIENPAHFHFANYEHVAAPPPGATVLARTEVLPAAALAFAGGWYSVQFHPESDAESLAVSWAKERPDLAAAYREVETGKRLIENFLRTLDE
jgi:GMP synthase-like glutamine amidotransferase